MTLDPAPTRRRGWSLRRRLVVGILALLAVVSLVVGGLSVLALRQSLVGRLDDQVRDAVARAETPFGAPGPGDVDGDGDEDPTRDGEPGNRIGTLVLRLDGDRVVRAEFTQDDGEVVELSDEQVAAITSVALVEDRLQTVRVPGIGEFRIGTGDSRRPGESVIAGLPTADVDRTLGSLALIFALVTLVALAIAALAGRWVVGVALRPLTRVTATARRVAELPLARGEVALAERVPDPDPATEVGQLGSALNRMLEHVESSLRSRQDSEANVRRFVADASHELRTPLASIRGYSELTRRSGLEVPEDIAFALARIEAESIRMSGLVDDLLLLARLDADRDAPVAEDRSGIDRAPVDLGPLVATAVADARAAAPDHDWAWVPPATDVVVRGDANRLHQVVTNLLANARVHTPPGTSVTVRLEVAGSVARLVVEDDGPGIPADLQPRLFERFVRGDGSRSRATGSTGLGLAIVAAVVEAHGGEVAVSSAPGATRFEISLPLASP